jgi:hypothetical protein
VVRAGQDMDMGSRSHSTGEGKPCRLPFGYHAQRRVRRLESFRRDCA